MCREGALAMYSSSNCVFSLYTGVVVTVSYICLLEIQTVHLLYQDVVGGRRDR